MAGCGRPDTPRTPAGGEPSVDPDRATLAGPVSISRWVEDDLLAVDAIIPLVFTSSRSDAEFLHQYCEPEVESAGTMVPWIHLLEQANLRGHRFQSLTGLTSGPGDISPHLM
jgi:hypothetical protein